MKFQVTRYLKRKGKICAGQTMFFAVIIGMHISKPISKAIIKPTCYIFMVLFVCIFTATSSISHADKGAVVAEAFEVNLRKSAAVFLDGLNAEQLGECLQAMDNKARWHKQYTGGVREGIQIKKLTVDQKKAMENLFRMVLSDYGWKMAETVAKQDGEQGLDNYYVACFGDPRKAGAPFALRLCEHHLTIVNLEIAGGKVTEFGPILLGANPPNLWLKDEEILMKAWKQQTEKNGHKGLLEKNSGISSKLMPADQGMLFTALKEETQATLKEAWEHRLKIFTPTVKARINELQQARGGWEKSRVAYYKNTADKRCKDGGKWDFKCGLPGMVWDFEGSRGHIHMSLCVHRLNEAEGKEK